MASLNISLGIAPHRLQICNLEGISLGGERGEKQAATVDCSDASLTRVQFMACGFRVYTVQRTTVDPWQSKGGRVGGGGRIYKLRFFSFFNIFCVLEAVQWSGRSPLPTLQRHLSRNGQLIIRFVAVTFHFYSLAFPMSLLLGLHLRHWPLTLTGAVVTE